MISDVKNTMKSQAYVARRKLKRRVSVIIAEINSDKRALAMQFYHPEQYRKEEEFYARVVKLLRSGETVTNPIKVLSEEEGVDKLPPEKQSQKILELAERYRRMVERYREDSKK